MESEEEARQIVDLDDIKRLVNTFYGRVRKDELIGPIFNEVIGNNWPTHLEKMYRFWQTVLLGEHTYQGAPFPPHLKLPVSSEHFNRWVSIFNNTVDSLFTGELAEEAKWRANKMATMFEHKIAYYKANNLKPLL